MGGAALEPAVDKGTRSVQVAAFQFAPPVPPVGTSPLGVSADWFSALPEVVERGYRLIVLPESVSSHAVQLDGVPAANLGAGRQVPADAWKRALAPLLPSSDTFIALGVEGAERGEPITRPRFGTTVVSSDGNTRSTWFHSPNTSRLDGDSSTLQALTYYQAGKQYLPIDAGPFRIGSFIRQEVQHAGAARELTRRGANILITGGNDGVFADRRVAEVHHSMARIRATEVRRFIVRAMKDGVTSIAPAARSSVGRLRRIRL